MRPSWRTSRRRARAACRSPGSLKPFSSAGLALRVRGQPGRMTKGSPIKRRGATMTETTWLDATAQAELVRRGEISAAELVEAAIGRIEAVNPKLDAVIRTRFDQARAEAAGDLPEGPFRGVP